MQMIRSGFLITNLDGGIIFTIPLSWNRSVIAFFKFKNIAVKMKRNPVEHSGGGAGSFHYLE
jgi:hypothetical protein